MPNATHNKQKQPPIALVNRWLFCFAWFISFCPIVSAQTSYIFKGVHITGNKTTKPEILIREMTVHTGDSLLKDHLPAVLLRNQQNIYNLGLFNKVEVTEETNATGDSILFNITVKERWYIFVAPGLVVEERNSYDVLQKLRANLDRPLRDWEIPYYSYNLTAFWKNMTGHNESLLFAIQGGFAKRYELGYYYPRLLSNHTCDFNAEVYYIERKQIIAGTDNGKIVWGRMIHEPLQTVYGGRISLKKRFNPFNSLFVSGQFIRYQMNDSIRVFNPQFLTATDRNFEQYPIFSAVYLHDVRDVKAYPLKGLRYRFGVRIGGGLPGSTASFVKGMASFAQFIPLSKRWNFAYGTQNMITIGKKLPYYEKSFVWIDRHEFPDFYNEIRGYESYAIDATFISIQKAELKYALIPRQIIHIRQIPFRKFQDMPLGVYLTSFLDVGYVGDNSTTRLQDSYLKNKALYGYGVGVNILTIYDLLGRFELSRNHLGTWNINMHAVVPIK